MRKMAAAKVLFAAISMAGSAAQAQASEGSLLLNCPLNKLYSLQVRIDPQPGAPDRVTLEEKYFFETEGTRIAELEAGQDNTIEYGNVLMVSRNFGRSGYVFLRLEKHSEREYDAYFDINLFQNQSVIQTRGALVRTSCDRFE